MTESLSKCCGARLKRYVKSRNRGSGVICTACGNPCEVVEKPEDTGHCPDNCHEIDCEEKCTKGVSPTPRLLSEITCASCSKKLIEQGGLFFSPPDENGMVKKTHFCKECSARQSLTAAEMYRLAHDDITKMGITGIEEHNAQLAGKDKEIAELKAEIHIIDLTKQELQNHIVKLNVDHQAKLVELKGEKEMVKVNSWRPEGWFNEYENAVIEPYMAAIKAACLELGADRMLEALRKRAKEEAESRVLTNRHLENALRDGMWLFIPDDK